MKARFSAIGCAAATEVFLGGAAWASVFVVGFWGSILVFAVTHPMVFIFFAADRFLGIQIDSLFSHFVLPVLANMLALTYFWHWYFRRRDVG